MSLAALVDLLFVIMFLEFTDLRNSAVHVSAQAKAEAAEERSNRSADDKLKVVADDQVATLRNERFALLAQVEEFKNDLDKAHQENAELQTRADSQLNLIGEIAKEVLSGVGAKAAEQLEKEAEPLRTTILKEIAATNAKSAAQIVQIFRRSLELQKHTDLWEVHLFPEGTVRVRGPDGEARTFQSNGAAGVERQFMAIVHQSKEPIGSVLILFTHGNAQAKALADVTKGLDQVRTHWAAELGRERSFHVSAPSYSKDAP